ncbi:RNA recognition motif domain-containing protein [Thiovibrio sp. JS02]
MNMYIGNLAYGVTEEELKEIFSAYGEVASVSLVKDRFSGQSKGFGFIEMPNNSEADTAIKALNKSMLKGRDIKVNQAEQKKKNTKRRRPQY